MMNFFTKLAQSSDLDFSVMTSLYPFTCERERKLDVSFASFLRTLQIADNARIRNNKNDCDYLMYGKSFITVLTRSPVKKSDL